MVVIEAVKAEAKVEELGNSDGGPVEAAHMDEPSGVTWSTNQPLSSHSQLKIHFSIQQQLALFSLALTTGC